MEKKQTDKVEKNFFPEFKEKNVLFLVNFFQERKLLEKFRVDEELKVNVEQQILYFLRLNSETKKSESETEKNSFFTFVREKISLLGDYKEEDCGEILNFSEEWYVNYNYLLTYIQNVYQIQKDFFLQTKIFKNRSTSLLETGVTQQEQSQAENERRTTFKGRFPVHPFLNKNFYPFLTKPKIMVLIKKMLFSLEISLAFLINAFAVSYFYFYEIKSSKLDESLTKNVFLSDVGSLFLIYYLFDRKQQERDKYNISSFLLGSILVHFFLLLRVLTETLSTLKESKNSNFFSSFFYYAFLLNGFSIFVLVIVSFFKKPKLDKEKIIQINEAYRRELNAYFTGKDDSSNNSPRTKNVSEEEKEKKDMSNDKPEQKKKE